ncbi:MAG: hypothetical protein SGI83_15730 [Bacteroidota bacterium]|nr:hypothetical protein [Bacteroidota bacterium]
MPGKKSSHSFNEKRRKLLRIIGLGTAVAAGQSVAGQIRPERNPQRIPEKTTDRPKPEITNQPPPTLRYITVKLLRPYDLLSLDLRYYNCTITGGKVVKRSDPAYLVVIFQPQTISEQAWNETNGGLETPTVPGKMLISGESRLAFKIPANVNNIPLDVKQLLDWEKYELLVNDRAKQPTGTNMIIPQNNGRIKIIGDKIKARTTTKTRTAKNTKVVRGMSKDEKRAANILLVGETMNSRADAIVNIRENLAQLAQDPVGPPRELETSLEVPLRLYLSPTKLAGWSHLTKLDPDNGILKQTNQLFELWHTRMGTKTIQGIDESDLTIEQRIVRALWADDAKVNYKDVVIEKPMDNMLGLTSLTNKDRHQIVHESSNFTIPGFVPPPIKAYKLFLSTLGAWLDSELVVERKKLNDAGVLYGESNSLNLLKWRHIETMAREHYVEIVRAGNIMPFGHEAVLIKITERKPHAPTGTAANFQRKIVVITQPVKEYNYRAGNGEFMNFCFSRIEMITTVSPLLDVTKKKLSQQALPGAPPPTPGEEPTVAGDEQFVIMSDQKEVLFKVKAEDLDGNLVDFTLPLAFVSTDVLGSNSYVDSLIAAYNGGSRMANRSDFQGQKFTLAPQATNGADTSFTAKSVLFKTKAYRTADEPQGFMPILGEADIIEPSFQKLAGSNESVPVTLEDDNNKGNVFAKFVVSKAINFSGNTDKTGGMAAPNFNLTGISKAAGSFGGDLNKFKNGNADAEDFFTVSNNLPEPMLFGVFKLSKILDLVAGDNNSYSLAKPLAERAASKIPNLVTEETNDAIITSYVIKPRLKSVDFVFAKFNPKSPDNGFSIVTQVKAYKNNPSAPEFSTEAWLRNFSVGVVKISGSEYLVNINFKEIKFITQAGKKADVSVDMEDQCLTFGGPLRFVNEVIKLIDPKGFSDPPYVDVSLTGIKAGYTLALPNLQMGAFTLSNISLGAEVNLPFTGGPLTFGFRFCERQQPFTLTISCLGGGGFFGLELDLHGLRMIEAALEFGAAVSINLGVASGSVSVMAGIYFKMELVDGENNTQLTGYVRINGSVSVLGLITASLELYLALTWLIDKKKAYGEATLKIKVEVLFFSATVTVKAKKTFKGSGDDPNFRMCLTEGDWEEYCGAFAA